MQSTRELLEQGYSIVTSTQRLAHELLLQYNHQMLQSQNRAWPRAPIYSHQQWLQVAWQRYCQFKKNPPKCITPLQSRAIWQHIIRQQLERDSDNFALYNLDALTQQAMLAWRTLNQWHIDLKNAHYSTQNDHRQFALWALEYRHILRQNHYIDQQQISDYIIDHAELEHAQVLSDIFGHKIHFAGVDYVTAQDKRLQQTLQNASIEVTDDLAVYKNTLNPLAYYSFDSQQSQWQYVANWAYQALHQNPQIKIAIVLPQLSAERDKLERILSQTLNAHDYLFPENNNKSAFHISLGKSLSQYPIVAKALNLIHLFRHTLTADDISEVLLNPLIKGYQQEKSQRALLEQALRRKLTSKTHLAQTNRYITNLQNHSANSKVELLQTQLLEAAKLVNKVEKTQSYRAWSQSFIALFELFGCPGDTVLDSHNYQIWEKFLQCIYDLSSLDNVPTKPNFVSVSQAIDSLVNSLQQTPFQVQSSQPPISVMDITQISGLQFDLVWFANCDQTQWPPAPHPSAFLPISSQAKSGIPFANFDNSLAYAQHITDRLLNQCPEVYISYGKFENQQWFPPSPLISLVEQTVNQEQKDLIDLLAAQPIATEKAFDIKWTPALAQQTKVGSYVIKDQSECPFKAFARHRLNADFEEPAEMGLDAATQGTLVHQVMHEFWKKHKNSKSLETLDQNELIQSIRDITKPLTQVLQQQHGLDIAFCEFQIDFLNQRIVQWLEQELQRCTPFEVIASEKVFSLELAGLQFHFKIDRIDKINYDTQSYALIDYKTGRNENANNWFGDRISSPQMPLYFLSIAENDAEMSGHLDYIAYAVIQLHNCHYLGVHANQASDFSMDCATSSQTKNQIKSLDKISALDASIEWSDLQRYWHDRLSVLANEYADGVASVSPSKGACDYCNLHLLCRVNEDLETDNEQ